MENKRIIVFACEDAAKKKAKETGGSVDTCIILDTNGAPILDAGEPVKVYKVTF